MASYGSVPTSDPEQQQAQQQPKTEGGWRHELGEILEKPSIHLTVLGLTLLDATCVLFQIIYTFFHECQLDSKPSEFMLTAVEVADVMSRVITCLFLLELTLALVAFGPAYYLPGQHGWKLHLFDLIGKVEDAFHFIQRDGLLMHFVFSRSIDFCS